MNIVKEVQLGQGAYGEVFKTIDKNNDDHVVALKLMLNTIYDGDIGDSTFREINNMQILQHDNIVNVDPLVYNDGTRHAVFVSEEKPRVELSMEMLNGDLNSLGFDRLTSDVLRKLVFDITNGLYHMHSMGFTHNDLKPDNILYKFSEGVYTFKIADLGLSLYLGIPFPINVRDFLCTPTVKAPNSSRNSIYIPENRYNYNSDMFSLGATMFWTCMRRHGIHWTTFRISEREVFVDIRKPNFLAQTEILKEMYGEDGYDFMVKCMAPKSSERMSSKRALSHPYLRPFRGGAVSMLLTKFNNLYRQPSIEDVTEGVYELEYLEDMYNIYKDNTINLFIDFTLQQGRINSEHHVKVNEWIYEIFDKLNINSLETLLQYHVNLKTLYSLKKDIDITQIFTYSASLFRICDKLYSTFAESHRNLDQYTTIVRNIITMKTFKVTEKEILRIFDGKFPFTPILFFINYWYLKSIYTHPSRQPRVQVLTTGVAVMFAIMACNRAELSNVKVDDLGKYCIHKAITIQNYTDNANTLLVNVSDELKGILDGCVAEFVGMNHTRNKPYINFKEIILTLANN